MQQDILWKLGDRVRTNLEHAWVYVGTERESLMGKDRFGAVVDIPWGVKNLGHGTRLIRWESLTQVPLKRTDWWTHTDLLLRVK